MQFAHRRLISLRLWFCLRLECQASIALKLLLCLLLVASFFEPIAQLIVDWDLQRREFQQLRGCLDRVLCIAAFLVGERQFRVGVPVVGINFYGALKLCHGFVLLSQAPVIFGLSEGQ
ncbi:MAG: hypothetical protein DMG96_17870 [Acidobacteria bacterium]|nr:MAG: hypothetical protein DMG96_17870 [Acidobacteriota bacterium]